MGFQKHGLGVWGNVLKDSVPSWWHYWGMTEGKSAKLSGDFYSCALSSMGIRRGNYPRGRSPEEGLWRLSLPLLSAHLCLPSVPHHRPRNSQVTMTEISEPISQNKANLPTDTQTPPASASSVLGSEAHTSTSGQSALFYYSFIYLLSCICVCMPLSAWLYVHYMHASD